MNHIVSTISFVSLFLVLSLLTLLAFVGNVFVVLSVFKCPRLRAQSCFHFLAGLAVADICVTVLVMPWSMIYMGFGYWPMGGAFCKIWMSFDVLCCTASILHLCLVALDRYMAIAYPLRYAVLVNTTRMRLSMLTVWLISSLISFVPIHLGWYEARQEDAFDQPRDNRTQIENGTAYTDLPALINSSRPLCNLEVNVPYAIISSSTSFYIPFFVFCLLYGRILCIAHSQALQVRRIRIQSFRETPNRYYLNPERFTRTARSALVLANNFDRRSFESQATMAVDGPKSTDFQAVRQTNPKRSLQLSMDRRSSTIASSGRHQSTRCRESKTSRLSILFGSRGFTLRSHSAMKNEMKAIKTIGLLLGCFMICWLPFFLAYLIRAFCHKSCQYPAWLMTMLTWIGYANSAANPVLYAFFQKDFRMAVWSMLRHTETRMTGLRPKYNSVGSIIANQHPPLPIQTPPPLRVGSSIELRSKTMPDTMRWHVSSSRSLTRAIPNL